MYMLYIRSKFQISQITAQPQLIRAIGFNSFLLLISSTWSTPEEKPNRSGVMQCWYWKSKIVFLFFSSSNSSSSPCRSWRLSVRRANGARMVGDGEKRRKRRPRGELNLRRAKRWDATSHPEIDSMLHKLLAAASEIDHFLLQREILGVFTPY